MKAKEVIEELQKLNPESDVFISTDGKLTAIEQISKGQFFRSANIIAQFEYDVVRAEQTLLSCLAYQRDQLTGLVLNRIERALGKERVAMITAEFDRDKSVKEEEQELNKEELDNIEKALNAQETFIEATPDTAPVVEKPAKKKAGRKPSAKKEAVEEAPKKEEPKSSDELVVTADNAEGVLGSYYSGGSAKIPIEAVRAAKKILGEDKAREIFNKVRNG